MESRVAGMLLTGGSSARLGRDKAEVVLRGERLAERSARVLSAVCDAVIEVGPGSSGLEWVREDPPGGGPLAAVAAGWAELRRPKRPDACLVLAVDLPLVEEPLLRLIAKWPGARTAVPVDRGHPQVLCARYSAGDLDRVEGILAGGSRSMRDLLGDHDVIPEAEWRRAAPAEAFADVDTPGDLARLGGGQ